MNWKYILAIILLLGTGSYILGYTQGKGQKETQIVEKQGETKTVFRDRIVTVTRIVKPDGTVTETTKTEEKQGQTDKKTTDIATSSRPSESRYSLAIQYHPAFSELANYMDVRNYSAVAGYRVIGPMWIEAGGGFSGLTVGIRMEM